jgi:hypothetical protein
LNDEIVENMNKKTAKAKKIVVKKIKIKFKIKKNKKDGI